MSSIDNELKLNDLENIEIKYFDELIISDRLDYKFDVIVSYLEAYDINETISMYMISNSKEILETSTSDVNEKHKVIDEIIISERYQLYDFAMKLSSSYAVDLSVLDCSDDALYNLITLGYNLYIEDTLKERLLKNDRAMEIYLVKYYDQFFNEFNVLEDEYLVTSKVLEKVFFSEELDEIKRMQLIILQLKVRGNPEILLRKTIIHYTLDKFEAFMSNVDDSKLQVLAFKEFLSYNGITQANALKLLPYINSDYNKLRSQNTLVVIDNEENRELMGFLKEVLVKRIESVGNNKIRIHKIKN